jgi:hypothetical protein
LTLSFSCVHVCYSTCFPADITLPIFLGNATAQSNPQGPIRGFRDIPAGNTTQPFDADNIVLIGNGDCESTCAIFSYFMTDVGNVRSMSFGGRPQTGPMQLIGGTRGAQTLEASDFATQFGLADGVIERNPDLLSAQEKQEINTTFSTKPPAQWPVKISDYNVNIRNAYAQSDQELPLQFQYQASDARRFYTLENYLNPASVWRDARDAIWGNASVVEDSTGGQGSRGHRNSGSNSTDGSGSGTTTESGTATTPAASETASATNGASGLQPAGGVAALAGMVALIAAAVAL